MITFFVLEGKMVETIVARLNADPFGSFPTIPRWEFDQRIAGFRQVYGQGLRESTIDGHTLRDGGAHTEVFLQVGDSVANWANRNVFRHMSNFPAPETRD